MQSLQEFSQNVNGCHGLLSKFEFCLLCNEMKTSYVDVFETMVFRDGCVLASKLNGLYGIEASPDSELSKFICIGCLSEIRSRGNITYNLWSTLDYLIRMEEENNKMDRTSYNIPRNSLDFLFSGKGQCLTQPVVPQRHDQLSRSIVSSCRNEGDVECQSDTGVEGEMEVEFCWCSECNKEFLSRKELRLHSKLHRDNAIIDIHSQNNDSSFSSQEYKLISGEVSFLKSGLCCGKCEKEFKNEKRLVKHIERYDFRCKPRRFINLNNQLKDLESKRAEDNALQNPIGVSVEIDSELHVSGVPSSCVSIDSHCVQDGRILRGNQRELNTSFNSGVEGTVENSDASVKRSKHSRTSFSHVDPLPAIVKSAEKLLSSGFDVISNSMSLLSKPQNFSYEVVVCDYCTKPYALKSKLREHIVLCHLSVESYKCSVCYIVFASESELKIHNAIHFGEDKYICSVCIENFSSRAKVVMHLNDAHNMNKGYICSACFLCLPSKSELALHKMCHSSDKKYNCSKCGSKFINKNYFNVHVRVCQLGELAHTCKTCGKEFKRLCDLKLHLLIHDSNKRFACHLCPKRYVQSSTLLVHIRNFHLKIKPHECGICKRKFSIRQHLLVHYSVHSDDRPFKCAQCGKSFKTRSVVNKHMKLVHGKRQF